MEGTGGGAVGVGSGVGLGGGGGLATKDPPAAPIMDGDGFRLRASVICVRDASEQEARLPRPSSPR